MTDDIPLPIPSYQETLINSNERNINGLPNIDNDLELAINQSLKDVDDQLNRVTMESLLEFESDIDYDLEHILQKSLEEYEESLSCDLTDSIANLTDSIANLTDSKEIKKDRYCI